MERPGNLEPRTVSIMLVVISSLLFVFEIIALATPWYAVIFGNGSASSGAGYFNLFTVCSASIFGNICIPNTTAFGNATFAFGFFALLCFFISAAFWSLHTFAPQVLAPFPAAAKMGMGLLILFTPVLVIVSWVAWVIGFAVQASNNGGNTSGVSGHAGLAFSIIITIMSIIAAVLALWNKDQLGVDAPATAAAPAETSA